LTEDQSNLTTEAGYSKDVVEAETFARDFGRRRPDVVVTILRTTNVVGPKTNSSIVQFFSLPLVPTALGYDPRLQFVHEDDELEVLRRAVLEDHPGVFNVAGDGIIYLSQALRIARRIPLPLIAPFARVVADALRAAKVVDFPSDQVNLILHGRVVDNSRLKTVFGYQPKYSTVDAFRSFVEAKGDDVAGPRLVARWENDLYDFLTSNLRRRARAPGGPRALESAQ
jgi:UDP-glucose 4-epimerase